MDWNTVRAVPHRTSELTAPEQRRVLGRVERRKQFRVQVITAAIYPHPLGQELRMFLGDDTDNNLLHSELARCDDTPLEDKATALREVLLERGWTALEL